MAEATFDGHPLEQYLIESGDVSQPMPGGAAEFAPQVDYDLDDSPEENDDAVRTLPFPVQLFDMLLAFFSATHMSSQGNPFVERFKYAVITSSLLSLTGAHTARIPVSPRFPGNLSIGHSRTPSAERTPPLPSSNLPIPDDAQHADSWSNIRTIGVAFALLGMGHYVLGLLALLGAFLYMNQEEPKHDFSSLLKILSELTAASDIWESTVHEAITILENDERSIYYGPTTPASPSSSLRVALNSSLHTTQIQCDNVRQLLSALTSPAELTQLSEMYAPPSPIRYTHDTPYDISSPRPLSLPLSQVNHHRQRTTSGPTDMSSKRSTWNGTYSSLASAGSPTMQILKRREKRRSDLSSLIQSTSPSKSLSAPTTPADRPTLSDVREEELGDQSDGSSSESVPFGVAALELRRKRKTVGLEILGISSPRHISQSPALHSSTISSGSRFTTFQTARHPLSLSALNLALQGAVSSKRYACSHLLALRFTEEDDEGYWEDVKSVMGLLTTTFVDASSRLTEALEELEQKRVKDETPTPESQSRRTSLSPGIWRDRVSDNLADTLTQSLSQHQARQESRSGMDQVVSFAPVPTHLSRFAAHVEAISSALNEARMHLEQCITSLREQSVLDNPIQPPSPSQSLSQPEESSGLPALQAYESLRRELGLALRECERGRERLLDLMSPPKSDFDADRSDAEDLPSLGQDHGSDSDKADSSCPVDDDGDRNPVSFTIVSPDAPEGGVEAQDDATAHLLLTTTSKSLPPVGAEQVFESDSGNVGVFTRERSKLSREERIKLMRAKRESADGASRFGLGISDGTEKAGRGVEKWGPGGEVVRELKDVIYKVGERKRQMSMRSDPLPHPAPSIPTTALADDIS